MLSASYEAMFFSHSCTINSSDEEQERTKRIEILHHSIADCFGAVNKFHCSEGFSLMWNSCYIWWIEVIDKIRYRWCLKTPSHDGDCVTDSKFSELQLQLVKCSSCCAIDNRHESIHLRPLYPCTSKTCNEYKRAGAFFWVNKFVICQQITYSRECYNPFLLFSLPTPKPLEKRTKCTNHLSVTSHGRKSLRRSPLLHATLSNLLKLRF